LRRPGRPRKLAKEHIDYLASEGNLIRDCALTLEERAVRFHRWFPEIRISPSAISKLYKKLKIKKKTIQIKKSYTKAQQDKLAKDKNKMKADIDSAIDQGRKLLFADECLFSSKASQKTAFS
jgi:transposase